MEQELRILLQDCMILFSCEGTAEEDIIRWLLEEQKLFCSSEDIVDGGITGIRKADVITTKFLNIQYNKHLAILRIHDSKSEEFNLREVYRKKCSVYNIYTRPEIESLVIIKAGLWQDFCKKKKGLEKPSDYCKQILRLSTKERDFIKNYFGSIDGLIDVIKEYKRIHCSQGEYCLADILL